MLYNFFIFEEKIKKGIGINPQRENRKETPCGEPISVSAACGGAVLRKCATISMFFCIF
jgi:hypothetical protein